jgi:hypothetical protein
LNRTRAIGERQSAPKGVSQVRRSARIGAKEYLVDATGEQICRRSGSLQFLNDVSSVVQKTLGVAGNALCNPPAKTVIGKGSATAIHGCKLIT